MTCLDREIRELFYRLNDRDMARLLKAYADKYDAGAARYAAATCKSWRDGTVAMSGLTAERLLNLLPPLLPFDTRFELLKKVRERNFIKTFHNVSTSPSNWQADLAPAVAEVIAHGDTAALPDQVKNSLDWLSDGDAAVAEKMLDAAMQDEAIARIAYLRAEFERIEIAIASLSGRNATVGHTIELPQGSIRVQIDARTAARTPVIPPSARELTSMSNDLQNLPTGNDVASGQSRPNITLSLLESLSPEDRQKHAGKALEALIERERNDDAMRRRHDAANAGIARDIEIARQLGEMKNSSSALNSEHRTASGTTRIRVTTTSTSKLWVIAAGIIAVVVLILASK